MKRNDLFSCLFLLILPICSKATSTLAIDMDIKKDTRWVDMGPTEEVSIKRLIYLLQKSKSGRELLNMAKRKAWKKGLTLSDIIRPGNSSITDTTLIRRFSPHRPDQVIYETISKVLVDRQLSVIDALLDMAHELTHYGHRVPFNPYRGNFTLKEFLKSTVEGRGGEVEAYLMECRILEEIFSSEIQDRSNCSRIRNPIDGKLSRDLSIKEFYQVGKHMKSFVRNLAVHRLNRQDFPHLNNTQALFISSVYGLPYPLAAYKEYVSIMNRVCGNDYKRLVLFEQEMSRGPANLSDNRKIYRGLKNSYQIRCVGQGFSSLQVDEERPSL